MNKVLSDEKCVFYVNELLKISRPGKHLMGAWNLEMTLMLNNCVLLLYVSSRVIIEMLKGLSNLVVNYNAQLLQYVLTK